MEQCTGILKENMGFSGKEGDMSACVLEMQKKTNKPASNGGQCLLAIKQGLEDTNILILHYLGKWLNVYQVFYKELYYPSKHFTIHESTKGKVNITPCPQASSFTRTPSSVPFLEKSKGDSCWVTSFLLGNL